MERLMQYVWQHRLCPQEDLRTVDGERVSIIDPGLLNTDAGPDFFNAKVLIGDRLWAGNVEIHVRATDWARHGHNDDHAYDSVILHVVQTDDGRVSRPDGTEIPQIVMDCAADFSERYDRFVNNPAGRLRCGEQLRELPGLYVTEWISALGQERIYTKAERIASHARRLAGDWNEAAYITLARALGFGVNAQPMEQLAQTLPLKFLLKHRDSRTDLEALLLGQAGLLDGMENDEDDYIREVCATYRHLATKFGLDTTNRPQWKMARMRPTNFPHRRIAALAAMISDGFTLPSAILAAETEEDLAQLFTVELEGYWSSHYHFGSNITWDASALSRSSINVLIINVAIPFMYAWGDSRADSDIQQRATDVLQQLAGERNFITSLFESAGIKVGDAFSSQALIQLYREYCEPRKCLYCRWGHRFLSRLVKPQA